MNANVFFNEIFPKSYGFILSCSIYTIAKLGVADALEAPMTASEIAQKRGIKSPEYLERLMNFLASRGIFEKKDGRFCHTDMSKELQRVGTKIVHFHDLRWDKLADVGGVEIFEEEDEAGTEVERLSRQFIQARAIYIACRLNVFEKMQGPKGLMRHLEAMGLGRMPLSENCKAFILHENEERWKSLGRLDEAIKDDIIPFEKMTGMAYFDYLMARPDAMKVFSDAMVFISEFECGNLVPGLREILKPKMSVMDVGGGTGRYIREVVEAYPEVEGILFDLPDNIKQVPKGCKAIGGNFFEQVPEADVYLFKRVLHDWSDGDCVKILSRCAASAKPGAQLVLNEFLLPQPEALMIDTLFMSAFKGRQRTPEEFAKILAEAGWKMQSCKKTGCWLGQIVAVKE